MPDSTNIPVARPWLDEQEADAVRRVILSGWVTQGPEVAEFERELAAFVGAPHACAVSNCTTALHLALLAAGVQTGDEVITVSHSFIATANAVRYCGARPVFVDIEPNTYNIDPDKIAAQISPATRAILCVHQVGMPCELSRIVPLAKQHGLPVIEDAACAIGSEVMHEGHWEKIGKPHGDAACFSFHPRKMLTTGDGGIITTARADWDAKFRLWRQHGMSLPDRARHEARRVQIESYNTLGYNYRLTDVQAAMGRVQLEKLPAMIARRREQATRYGQLLRGIPGLQVPQEPAWARSNWQSYCVRLGEDCDQKQVMQQLLDAGIATRPGIMCSHLEPAYAEAMSSAEKSTASKLLCHSEQARQCCLLLPLFHDMTAGEQQRVADALAAACRTAKNSAA